MVLSQHLAPRLYNIRTVLLVYIISYIVGKLFTAFFLGVLSTFEFVPFAPTCDCIGIV